MGSMPPFQSQPSNLPMKTQRRRRQVLFLVLNGIPTTTADPTRLNCSIIFIFARNEVTASMHTKNVRKEEKVGVVGNPL